MKTEIEECPVSINRMLYRAKYRQQNEEKAGQIRKQ